jgi:pimeloyl-ACP methyl ester carboxylesterase
VVADAVAMHEALEGDGDAVLVGHDWGAEAAYGAAAFAPDRWRRVVTLAVPPLALDPVLFGDYQQLKRFFYLFLFRDSLPRAEAIVATDGMAFLDRRRPTPWRSRPPGKGPSSRRSTCTTARTAASAWSWLSAPNDSSAQVPA